MTKKHDKKQLNRHFPGQKPGEQIRILVRKHWIIDLKIVSVFFVLGVLPMLTYLLIVLFLWPQKVDLPYIVAFLGFLMYMLFACLVTFVKWLNEELDIIIITNERIIGHDQIDFFHKQISETNIAQVQDVKGVERGFWGSLLRYGSLEIQTAGNKIVFSIKNVANPYELARGILDIRDKHLDKEKFEPNPYKPI